LLRFMASSAPGMEGRTRLRQSKLSGRYANGAVSVGGVTTDTTAKPDEERFAQLQRVNSVRSKIDEFREANPAKIIPISADDMGIMLDYTYTQLMQYQELEGNYKDMSSYKFMDLMRGSRGDSDFGVYWGGEVFEVTGLPGGYSGRHNGNDINYVMEGMSWAARGSSMTTLRSAVRAWNGAQFGQDLTDGDISGRNLKQIPHAIRWADLGYRYFERKQELP
jgi:hypothetical protein